jgi:hypothetical protein
MLYKSKNYLQFIFIVIIFSGSAACHNYYKASRPAANNASKRAAITDSLNKDSRYFILRSGSEAYHMKSISLSDDRTTIECTLDLLTANHQLYVSNGGRSAMRYKLHEPNEASVLNEVHFYIDPDNRITSGHYILQLDKVQKIEVIEKDKKRTMNSYVIGALGYTVGAIAVVGIIIAATKSSCPFVSAYTNNEFVLQGEIYGGAIYPQLTRDDYMPLQMQPAVDGKLMVKISNELKEKQYTDFADLMVISHDKNSKVLSDEKGNLYSISNPSLPLKAWTADKKDVRSVLLKSNDDQLLHFDDTLSGNTNNYLIAQFKNERITPKAKLILSIKNSYWVDYLYTDLAKKFGSYYSTYVKKQNKKPASELIKWAKEQHIPLDVSIKIKTGWQKVTGLTTIGPLATREIVVPLDLANIADENIEIKLSSGFMFWEIDYAAIDFSEDKYFSVQTISPSTAVDETGKNVLPELIKKDNTFLEQPVPGNAVTLEYKCNVPADNISRSYVLHTRGYYTHSWNFKGSPKVAFLKGLKKPDAFPAYSLQLYKKFVNTNMASLAAK